MDAGYQVRQNLLDAGCSEASAGLVAQMIRDGLTPDALHEMRAIRCELMDALHLSQQRVDRLDYLIRKTEQEMKTTSERQKQI